MDDQASVSDSATSTETGAGARPAAPEATPPAPATIAGDDVTLVEGGGVSPEFSTELIEPDTGIALDGEYPVNHRLRAERLAAEGKETDPGGIVSDELIAGTATRLEGEKRAEAERVEAEEAANPPVRANMKTADLEKIAERQGIDITAAANNEHRVELIEAARAAGTATPANEGGR